MLKVSPIKIEQGSAVVPGMIIFGETEEEALSVAYMTRDHYELPGSKPSIHVSFVSNGANKVDLDICFDPLVGDVSISGVDKEVADNILTHIREVEKYVILIGYDHQKQNVIDSTTFSLFKNDLTFDNAHYVGKPEKVVDWNNLI